MKAKPKTMSASEFKARCLELLDDLDPPGILLTKQGRPVARVIPVPAVNNEPLIGSMKGKIKIKGDIFSTGVKWDVES
jgi:antitoxin (DNA-binding transcriptional repressor) of toxin-antitoxin stability system